MTAARYSVTARYLHWAVAGLIVVQFVLAEWAESAAEAQQDLQVLALLANHKSVGMTVLMLAVTRLVWRWRHPPPPLPATTPRWQARAAHAGHWLMYALLLVVPVSGWLMSSASAYAVSWFNLFTFPDLIAGDPAAKATLETVHETLAQMLFVVALGHIGFALWHQLHSRDGVLLRMTSPAPAAAGLGLMVAGVAVAWLDVAGLSAAGSDPPAAAESGRDGVGNASALPRWQVDYASSYIRFSATQAGAPFAGHFATWEGDIRFDASQLADSEAVVGVDLGSVHTGDPERDGTLGQPEWFGERMARFRASRFVPLDDGRFRTIDATLDFGHGAHPVIFTFAVARRAGLRTLDGAATLDRTALEVGTGEWRDTTWVGRVVEVSVHVEAPTEPP